MFRTNRPVTGNAFRDRHDQLARLHEVVDHLRAGEPQWVAVIGPRKVGKTSLILELERTVAVDDVAFVVLDAEIERPLSPALFRTYALRAADALLGPHLPTSLETTALTGGDYLGTLYQTPVIAGLPQDIQAVLRALDDPKVDPARMRLYLDLPERLAQELGVYVVIAFDEFQELATLPGKRQPDPFPVMRSAWQHHERVAYIVSGSGRRMLEDMVTQKHSAFFQHFSVLNVGPFEYQDAVDLLVEGDLIDEQLAQAAVDAVGTHPFYLQLLGAEVANQPAPLDTSSLKNALQNVLFSRTGRLALYFQNLYDNLVGRSAQLAAVLGVLADGPSRVTDVATRLHIRTGEVSRYIDRLGDVVVNTNDGRYTIDDHTFALWIRWRQPGGTVVPMTLIGDEAERQVAVTLSRLGFDLVYQSRASRGAFDLLATRNSRQLGIQVKRTKLPLRFDREAWARMQQDAEDLGWQWLLAAVDTDHRVTFLDPAKARHGAQVRVHATAAIDNVLAWMVRRPK